MNKGHQCKGCTKRCLGCHYTCESYIAFRQARDMANYDKWLKSKEIRPDKRHIRWGSLLSTHKTR